ncbi:hypothetical protein [Williamsia sp.]|uniref:hypothetical protein n=1 Tax=Williamsia sp. TaxID=1872085 RepID=UPI002F91C109
MTRLHSYRVDVAVSAVAAGRARSAVADLAQRQVTAAAIALMRTEGLSDRKIAAELGISKSSIRAMSLAPLVDSALHKEVERLAHAVWVDMADLAGEKFVVDGDDVPSFERMVAHGIELAFPSSLGRADTLSREYVQMTTGERILVFSQARWNGYPDQAAELGWDHRGSYLIHRCPGLIPGGCAKTHTVIEPTALGLEEGAEVYGSGWNDRKPTAHQVWKVLTAAIEERYEVFDPSYPENELRRRPGTTPRYPARADAQSDPTEVKRQTNR